MLKTASDSGPPPAAAPLSQSTRRFAPDCLKAGAMYGVVFIHTIWLFDDPVNEALAWFARTAVPCFIITWACFFERGLAKGRAFLPYAAARFGHLFVVFVVWSLIYYWRKEPEPVDGALAWLVRHFSGGAWPGQYFFLIVFQLIPLFPILRWTYAIPWLRWSLLAGVLLLYLALTYAYADFPWILRKLQFRPFVYHLPYVFLGIALARGHLPKLPPAWALLLLLIPVEFGLLHYFDKAFSPYMTTSVVLAATAIGAIALQSTWKPAGRWIETTVRIVGANTLTIFVANPLLIGLLNKALFGGAENPVPGYLEVPAALGFAVAVVALAVALAWVIRKCRLTGILN